MSKPSVLSRSTYYQRLLRAIEQVRASNPEFADRKLQTALQRDPGFKRWYDRRRSAVGV